MNTNVQEMLNKVYSEDKAHELSNVVDSSVKNGIVCSSLREYYITAVRASEQVQENATWCNAYLVAAIVSSENFTKAFKDRTDLANALGYTKGTISKLLGVVELKDKLFSMGYVDLYTVGQLSELLPTYNNCKKNKLSILPYLEHMKFNKAMTSKQVRDGIKSYNNSLVSVKPKTESTPVTTSSISAAQVNVVETPVIDVKVVDSNETKTVEQDKLHKAINDAVQNTKTAKFNLTTKNNKKHNLDIPADKLELVITFLVENGIMSVNK